MKPSLLLTTALTLFALPTLAEEDQPETPATMQAFILREGHMALLLDDQCHVLDKTERATLEQGYAHFRTSAQQGKMTGTPLSAADLKEIESFGDDVVSHGLPCNEKVEGIILDAHAKLSKFEGITSNPALQEANNRRNSYLKVSALNQKCHFYVDEMTKIFEQKAAEQLKTMVKITPGYETLAAEDAAQLQTSILKASEDICQEDSAKQFTTVMAWEATDTFAKTVVLAPDCHAQARCDLPSKHFKKK